MNILFVCTGNICRSSFAEYASKKLAEEFKVFDFTFSSCGVGAREGMRADAVGVEVAKHLLGVDMSPHKARQVSAEIVNGADILVAMDRSHLDFLKVHFPHRESDCVLFMNWQKNSGFWVSKEIVDPFKRGKKAFQKSFAKLYKRLHLLFESGAVS